MMDLFFFFLVILTVYLVVRKVIDWSLGKKRPFKFYIEQIIAFIKSLKVKEILTIFIFILKDINYSGLIVLIMFFSPIFILGFQIINYLKKGFWEPLSLIDILQYFHINWALWPTNWIGLWKILNVLNASVPIIFLCLMILMLIKGKPK